MKQKTALISIVFKAVFHFKPLSLRGHSRVWYRLLRLKGWETQPFLIALDTYRRQPMLQDL